MPIDHFVVRFVNTSVDPGNYQLVDFDRSPSGGTPTDAQIAAQLAAYFALTGSQVCASGTQIESISVRHSGSPGLVAIPFPTTEYAAIVAAVIAAGGTIPGMGAGYGANFGAGALSPLGTSISVTELTATPGPTGRGRHFLPFINTGCVSAAGGLLATQQAFIRSAWDDMIFGIDGAGAPFPPMVNLSPVVTDAAQSHGYPILSIRPQPVFSNLESRRR